MRGHRAVTVDAAPADQPDWDMAQLLAPGAPATWHTTQSLYVDLATAKKLQRDLLALWHKYDARRATTPSPALIKHVLQLQLAPYPDSPRLRPSTPI